MAIEAFDRAKQVLVKLQTSDDFEHAGRDSRGIRIQTDSMVKGIAELAITFPPEGQSPIILMAALIGIASQDYGTYVRVKGGSHWIGFDIRGLVGPLYEGITLEELSAVAMRRSGVSVDLYSDGRSGIGAHSDFLEIDGKGVGEIINVGLKMLPDEQRTELACKFLDVVAQEVAQSGEFLDL